MNIKKNFLSRIARRKCTAQAESEEGYEIPPPTSFEPSIPYATGNSEDKELGSHQELELIASGEPAPTGSTNRVDAVDGGDAPALEALSSRSQMRHRMRPSRPVKQHRMKNMALTWSC
ncbi:MAG: hypothetical protein F4X91_14390 [Nitrospinae bacterium]|nr:hypothetical protein [Nitrospinota bacterium]